ncbi:MAG: methylated-DNA--[protein]-cysteine S-methyltransferase [Defluviitaleaceae bacterium]|nr:methylated-DNA--[protein]-cysteine S-methyltransferase [Defluviitaleaceae bacterium]
MREYVSPAGTLIIAAENGKITEIKYLKEGDSPNLENKPENNAILEQCEKELDAYFAGTLQNFTVPINPKGTPFRMNVWKALQTIPHGKTISYKELAIKIGNPAAVRAVGGANHHNPINIIIPCHRVIGSNGSLTGYGGGLDKKEFLLNHERSM